MWQYIGANGSEIKTNKSTVDGDFDSTNFYE